MKNLILLSMMVFGTSLFAFSQTYVNGYIKKGGTYVQGHYRSTADSNPYINGAFRAIPIHTPAKRQRGMWTHT